MSENEHDDILERAAAEVDAERGITPDDDERIADAARALVEAETEDVSASLPPTEAEIEAELEAMGVIPISKKRREKKS